MPRAEGSGPGAGLALSRVGCVDNLSTTVGAILARKQGPLEESEGIASNSPRDVSVEREAAGAAVERSVGEVDVTRLW